MNTKEYLQQYQSLDREINRLLDEKQRWMDLTKKVTPICASAGLRRSGGSGRMPAAGKIAEWEQKIDAKVNSLVELRGEIEKTVDEVKDSRQKEVLLRRYVHGQKWEEIAIEMHIDYRWARRLHNRAVESLTLESPPETVIG